MSDQADNCQGESYTVQAGDTLSKIAQKFNLSVERLITANPQIKDPNQIFVGQVICIPTGTEELVKKAVVLRPPADSDFSDQTGGVVLIQELEAGDYAVTFAAIGIPEPETIGDFDTYLGSIRIDGQAYSAILEKSASFEQEPTWAGTRIIADNPFAAPASSAAAIVPFNLETDLRTNPVLIGMITD